MLDTDVALANDDRGGGLRYCGVFDRRLVIGDLGGLGDTEFVLSTSVVLDC